MLGALAAALTSLSYLPQVKKAWPRGSTHDFSWKLLSALTAGLALWIICGLAKGDWIIVAANGVGGTLSGIVLVCKISRHDVEGRGVGSGSAQRRIVKQLLLHFGKDVQYIYRACQQSF
jgi:MtN3 and saliva related transmembrane protein